MARMQTGGMRVFSGSAHPALAAKVCSYMGISPGKAEISSFPDGERLIRVEDDVRGRDCFIIQPTCPPANDNLMELYLLARTMKRSSVSSITAVIPYYGYARQDRKTKSRVPISAADVATLIEVSGVDRVVAVDSVVLIDCLDWPKKPFNAQSFLRVGVSPGDSVLNLVSVIFCHTSRLHSGHATTTS